MFRFRTNLGHIPKQILILIQHFNLFYAMIIHIHDISWYLYCNCLLIANWISCFISLFIKLVMREWWCVEGMPRRKQMWFSDTCWAVALIWNQILLLLLSRTPPCPDWCLHRMSTHQALTHAPVAFKLHFFSNFKFFQMSQSLGLHRAILGLDPFSGSSSTSGKN